MQRPIINDCRVVFVGNKESSINIESHLAHVIINNNVQHSSRKLNDTEICEFYLYSPEVRKLTILQSIIFTTLRIKI